MAQGSDDDRVRVHPDLRTSEGAVGVNNCVPQSPQNLLSNGLSALHLVQRLASAAPQSPQKRLLSGLPALQLEQRNRLPRPKMAASLCHEWDGSRVSPAVKPRA